MSWALFGIYLLREIKGIREILGCEENDDTVYKAKELLEVNKRLEQEYKVLVATIKNTINCDEGVIIDAIGDLVSTNKQMHADLSELERKLEYKSDFINRMDKALRDEEQAGIDREVRLRKCEQHNKQLVTYNSNLAKKCDKYKAVHNKQLTNVLVLNRSNKELEQEIKKLRQQPAVNTQALYDQIRELEQQLQAKDDQLTAEVDESSKLQQELEDQQSDFRKATIKDFDRQKAKYIKWLEQKRDLESQIDRLEIENQQFKEQQINT